MKKMYSINLAAYIQAVTCITPEQYYDAVSHTYYWVYPDCNGVKVALKDYRQGNPSIRLHDFLRAIKQLRVRMHPVGGVDNV